MLERCQNNKRITPFIIDVEIKTRGSDKDGKYDRVQPLNR
jgi:hypothetical protein